MHRPDVSRSDFWDLDLDHIAFIFLWVFIFFVPWEEALVVPQHIAMSHLVGAGAAAVGILAILQRGRLRRLHAIHYVAAALVIWATLSAFWTIDRDLTSVRIGSYLQLFFMTWLIWEFAREESQQMALMAAYVSGAWVSSISTIYSFVTGTTAATDPYAERYTGMGANENELGIVLALALAMACYLCARNKSPRIFWLLSVPVCLVAIVLTGSRGSFISVSIACLMFPFSLSGFSRSAKVAGGVSLIILTALALALLPSTAWDRIASIPSELSQGTLTKRTFIWSAGLAAYRNHPLLGVGAGAFGASVYRQLDIAYFAHNSYLSVLVELGAVGMILFATLLASLLHAAFSLPKLPRIAWVILLTTWGVAVLSVTWEHRKPTWFLFGLLIAQSDTLRVKARRLSKPVRLREHGRYASAEVVNAVR